MTVGQDADPGFVCVCGWQIRPHASAYYACCKGCGRDFMWHDERWWLEGRAAEPQPALETEPSP